MSIKNKKRQSIKESKKEVAKQAKARRKIALWIVQHFDGPKPIKTIEVGKIYTHGIFESGGRSVSIIINTKKQNIVEGISMDRTNNPTDSGSYFDDNEYNYIEKAMTDRNLEGIKVIYWEGKQRDVRYKNDSRYQ
ncbi:hypothetical protein [Ligilactobacillus apodemi]|uniref:Uncharacterized protein n=1 Tax=Ligilactobacillus apodemi DSM 16634 = JCM 16172 TaxID=1423724 RepID=A0A0R1TQT7_9LACO|nr:hypothetical protein [Ligilactobacillus apodemi]KRL83804.1 hypothetical protein FC32_GL001065 [Ligilactobacillus apodemi DSM 16634 = JCM 16172]MCR1900661.1 hypothetical protein [Ligilactobacillus apodemi]